MDFKGKEKKWFSIRRVLLSFLFLDPDPGAKITFFREAKMQNCSELQSSNPIRKTMDAVMKSPPKKAKPDTANSFYKHGVEKLSHR